MVERWGQGERGNHNIGGDGVHDEFQEGLPEECSAQRRWMGRHTVSWFLNPTNHTHTVRDVNHPPKFLRQGEVRR